MTIDELMRLKRSVQRIGGDFYIRIHPWAFARHFGLMKRDCKRHLSEIIEQLRGANGSFE